MRRFFLAGVLLLSVTLSGFAAEGHQLTQTQAQRLAVLVAKHDHIDLSDTHIQLNSMDLGRDFIPGYASFIIIKESMVPGPDETLRRFAISRRTADVWEMTLCTRYSFPELARAQHAYVGRTADQSALEQKRLGCAIKSDPKL
jgi:hypothetical protein